MVIFFGPPGVGKSVQGQLLAARHGWRWLSTGQLLRDSKNERLQEAMSRGELVSDEDINKIIGEALNQAKDMEDVILDGYPRKIEQAEWLVKNIEKFGRQITGIISLNVPDEELYKRLKIRGRLDDTPDNITKRRQEYNNTTKPVIEFLSSRGICTQEVDGQGTVGSIHDRVEAALEQCSQE